MWSKINGLLVFAWIPLFLQKLRTPAKCAAEKKMAPALPSYRPMAVIFSFAKENHALWDSVTEA